ncbi:uncharacterized protein LOC135827422 [Sycon ciliatum]|uniref:uncharacterized protein LOC135827422 n=1 Tax=Sycon ciliatum TaxID=27933 RepID=UPI0031F60A38
MCVCVCVCFQGSQLSSKSEVSGTSHMLLEPARATTATPPAVEMGAATATPPAVEVVASRATPEAVEMVAATTATAAPAAEAVEVVAATTATAAPAAEGIVGTAHNPFKMGRFVCDIQPWINTVDADQLRNAVVERWLITDNKVVDRLKRILSSKDGGQSAHNEELINLLTPGRLEAYQALCDVIKKLGYEDKSKVMLSILPGQQFQPTDTGNPFDLKDFVCDIQLRLQNVDADRLQKAVIGKRLITDSTVIDRLKRILSSKDGGQSAHNEELVKLLRAGGLQSYHDLCNAIEELRYVAIHEAMLSILQEQQLPLPCTGGKSLSTECEDVDDVPSQVLRVQKLLKDRYYRAQDTFASEMLPVGVAPTVEHVQVNLVMLNKSSLSKEFEQDNFIASSYDMWRVEHAFTDAGEKMTSVELGSLGNNTTKDNTTQLGDTLGTMAVASAGCGKTFVFTKVAPLRWAMGQLWKRKKLVVARELRRKDVRDAESLSELLYLKGIGIEDSHDRQVICDYVRQHPDCLTLILDGLDETNLSDLSSFLHQVITGDELPGAHILVTSRPCADAFSLSALPFYRQHVELVGFRPDDVKTYINKVLRPEKASELITEVERSSYLRGMMATPFIAKEVCTQYHCSNRIPRCIADLFDQMIIQILERKSGNSYKQWSSIPKNIRKLALEIGEFAFSRLVRKQLIFDESDIQQHSLSEDAILLGLLVTDDVSLSREEIRQYRFSHLTVQEYLAALYQVHHKPMTNSRITRLVECLGGESAHMRTFWFLLCAQLETVPQADCLVYALLTKEKTTEWDGDMNELDLLEWQNSTAKATPNSLLQSLGNVSPELRQHCEDSLGGQYMNTDGSSLQGDISKSRQILAYLCYSELVNHNQKMNNCQMQSIRALLASYELKLRHYSHPAEHRAINTALQHHPDAVQSVNVDDWSSDHSDQFPCSLGQCCGIKMLNVVGVNDTAVSDTIQQCIQASHESLHSLYLVDCTDNIVANVIPAVSSCKQLEDIEVGRCEPTPITGVTMANALSAMTSVTSITMTEINDPGISATTLSTLKNLTNLSLWNCGLTARSLPAIINALQCLPQLEELDLQGNDLSDMNADYATTLPLVSLHLTDLQLSECQLTARSLPAITHILLCCSQLQELNLSGNDFSDMTAGDATTLFVVSLSAYSHLTELDISDCGLTATTLPAITTGIQCWTQLDSLDLGGNDFQDVTASQATDFIAAVNNHTNISKLALFSDEEMEYEEMENEHYTRLLSPQSYLKDLEIKDCVGSDDSNDSNSSSSYDSNSSSSHDSNCSSS